MRAKPLPTRPPMKTGGRHLCRGGPRGRGAPPSVTAPPPPGSGWLRGRGPGRQNLQKSEMSTGGGDGEAAREGLVGRKGLTPTYQVPCKENVLHAEGILDLKYRPPLLETLEYWKWGFG